MVGSPVRHSLSPLLLNAAFTHSELDWVFCAFDIGDQGAGAVVAAMRTFGLEGLSVTMPLKTTITPHLDGLDSSAERLGAVNCVARRGDRLVGYSTDGVGLVDTLRFDEGFEPAGKQCVVFGAGGAARATVAALGDAGAAEVVVVNRTPGNAAIAVELAGPNGRVGESADVAAADLVVNATPIGMHGTGGVRLPFDENLLGAGQVVYDMVYDPLETPLVAAARRAGAHAVGGVGMLVHQAARAFSIWTGEDAPVQQMTKAVAVELTGRTPGDPAR